MGCKHGKSAWLLAAGIGWGCGDGLVDVDPTDGTETTTSTTDEPTTDPTIEPTTVSATMTTDDTTTDPSDTTPTTDETTDPTDTDPTDTDPTTGETSDSDTDPSTSTDPSDSDSETTGGVSDTDETTDSDSESESETDISVGFIVDPDAGGFPNECSVWDQDCPEGEKCMPWANDGGSSWNATRCTPLDPNPGQIGDVCTVEGSGVSGIDSCDIGIMCWNVDPETNEGTCVGMCQGSENNPVCEDPQASCAILNSDILVLCLPSCDPLIQDCDGNEVCIPIDDSFICAPDASGAGGQQNDPCEYLNVCDPGLLCIDAGLIPDCNDDVGCCTSLCDLDNGGADAFCVAEAGNGAACVPFFEEGQAPPGLEDVGICVDAN